MDIGFLHLETRSAVVRWLTWTQIVTQRMRGLEFPNNETLQKSLEFPLFLLSNCADSIPVAELRSDATAFFLQLILRANCNHQTRKCPKGWAVSQCPLQAEKRTKRGNIHQLLNQLPAILSWFSHATTPVAGAAAGASCPAGAGSTTGATYSIHKDVTECKRSWLMKVNC